MKKILVSLPIVLVIIFLTSCNFLPEEEAFNVSTNNYDNKNNNGANLGFTESNYKNVLNKLNQYRSELGLPQVDLNLGLSEGALLHTEYMSENNTVTHYQEPDNPSYNPLGAITGMNSVLAGNVSNAVETIDLWMNSLYHRQYLLNPDLENIGFSYSDGFATMNLGINNSYSDTEINKDNENYFLESIEPIIYPFDGQINVPIKFDVVEFPNPIPDYLSLPTGPFITISFNKFCKIEKINEISITDKKGNTINKAHFLAQNKDYILAILPENPLSPNTKYIIDVELRISSNITSKPKNEEEYFTYKKVWSFTTGNAKK
ncbi:MAG: CAP domain-containing protein [bacterium]